MKKDHEHKADAPEQDMLSVPEGFAQGDTEKEPAEGVTSDQIEAAAEYDADTEVPEVRVSAEPAPKFERLQKILAQAGVASRRHAEELITQGRVQVNGQTVTVLGTKADPERDHIRVDGKLLHGAERLRYFMLNKPRGYVTTVTDPEGRPTVMEFFAKAGERLYPVGRLDFQSEGLLVVTNDGELANGLTKAAHNVEKTYLVKVAGQPAEDELDRLREGGVAIERGRTGEGKVRTAPARIRQVRQGDNPWYEVVLIEGRNRELRKMFEEIGHHVEKIRRVGYGPLVLDMEPGKFRELEPEEVHALRMAAAGKLKPRRIRASGMLPKEAGRSAEQRGFRAGAARGGKAQPKRREDRRPERGESSGGWHEARPFRSHEPRGERPREGQFQKDSDRRDRGRNGSSYRAPSPAPRRGNSGFERREGEARGPQSGRSKPAQPAKRREEGFRGEERERRPFPPRGERPQFARTEDREQRFRGRNEAPGRGFKPRSESGFGRTAGQGTGPGVRREFDRSRRPDDDRKKTDSRPRRERAPAWPGKGRRAPDEQHRPATGSRSKSAGNPGFSRGGRPSGGAKPGGSRGGGPRPDGRKQRPEGRKPGRGHKPGGRQHD